MEDFMKQSGKSVSTTHSVIFYMQNICSSLSVYKFFVEKKLI